MIRRQLAIGTFMIIVSALFHVACLTAMIEFMHWLGTTLEFSDRVETFVIFGVAVLGIIAIHVIEAVFWAWAYVLMGQFKDLATALYFSIVTTTTLGYGDFTLAERWRLVASLQAIGGLILFGASAAFLFEVFQLMFTNR